MKSPRRGLRASGLGLVFAALAGLAGACSSGSSTSPGTGGARDGSGGTATNGGTTSTSSTSSTGGTASLGGVASTGGTLSSGAALGGGGLPATGGSSKGGTVGNGGMSGTGGVVADGGTAAGSGGVSGRGGSGPDAAAGSGGAVNGSAGSGGFLASTGGSTATGYGGAGGSPATGGSSGSAGAAGHGDPFGCKFGWGEPSPASYSWLQWATNWMGQSIKADGSVSSCETCSWLQQLASTNLVPSYYAYIIGFYGHVNGLPDGNQSGGPNLTTGAGALILGTANSACPSGQICDQNKIVQAYAYYAKQSHAVWPTKPLIWLLEGDYVQYASSSQTQPLTYQQLGQLAALITTAIKTNMPNAIVAMDHSTWNSDDVTNSFWNAMKGTGLDLVWTTGVGNNNGFMVAGTNGSTYNGKTCTYSYLRTLTGMKILVDESAGLSQASDTWSNQPASTINARISEGVIGINVSGAPSNYQSNVASLSPQLNSTCP